MSYLSVGASSSFLSRAARDPKYVGIAAGGLIALIILIKAVRK